MRARSTLTKTARTFSTSCSCLNSTATTTYQRPLKAGQLPVYDEALSLLQNDREEKLKRLAELNKKNDVGKEVLEEMEVRAWVNDPEIRWKAKNGLGDMSKPVFRHLAEKKWRTEGDLAILMQRVTQMSVTPDVVPDFEPTIDVRIQVEGKVIEPGSYVLPNQTREPFHITAQVYHPEARLYTLVVVDPDVPDETSQSFTTLAHWMIPNIPLSSTQSTIPTASALLPYIPPHPQNGTPYHRYTLLLLAQNEALQLSEHSIEREGFSVRQFVQENGMKVEGISFFRQKWDNEVSKIYKEILELPEPRFGRPPKFDIYQDRPKKYQLL